ncbi:unnamed protein product [Vicia faba]|uniref:Uncharacterized protein n=1 Tax=Vicia faba TaxID=3906 RepID=A0AAV1ADY6_VICFA|nr:unnamed protein product [Vicia faba]
MPMEMMLTCLHAYSILLFRNSNSKSIPRQTRNEELTIMNFPNIVLNSNCKRLQLERLASPQGPEPPRETKRFPKIEKRLPWKKAKEGFERRRNRMNSRN